MFSISILADAQYQKKKKSPFPPVKFMLHYLPTMHNIITIMTSMFSRDAHLVQKQYKYPWREKVSPM